MKTEITTGTWFQQFLDDSKIRYQKPVWLEKSRVVMRFINATMVNLEASPDTITRRMVKDFCLIQLNERGGNCANRDRKAMACAWRWGEYEYDEEWPDVRNPFNRIRPFPEKRHPRYVPPMDDFQTVLNYATGQDKVLLLAYFSTAARRSELFRLKFSDVDFDRDRIKLGTRKRSHGTLEYDWLPMTKRLSSMLKCWVGERRQQIGTDPDHVFVCLDTLPANANWYGKPFKLRQHFMKRICERAGVKPFGFHGIRHLRATTLYNKPDIPVSKVQCLLRHQNAGTTETYLHSMGHENIRADIEEDFLMSA